MPTLTRREFVTATAGAALWAAAPGPTAAAGRDLSSIYREIERRHDEAVARLQEWIRQPSIAAENTGMDEGCELVRKLALDAGFQHAERIATKGHPGVFATLDAGARETLGLYFMYDVKQADPAEWSSPPWDGKLVEMPGKGMVLMGRGATNQKGPQAAPRRAARDPRRRAEAAGQPRPGCGRRGGDRLAQLPGDRDGAPRAPGPRA
jgi:hypothetical protein